MSKKNFNNFFSLVMRTFQTYSFNNVQICDTVLLTKISLYLMAP